MNNINADDKDYLKPNVDPNKAMLGVRAVKSTNDATCRTVATVRGHVVINDEASGTDTGPTPMENVLVSLLGCDSVIINMVAGLMDFKYSGVDMEADGEVDRRGSR
ncbi:MAG: OsmC family protein, partial [Rhodospirillales bacterium]|nr:OsmC family protein [Rhodospirillales bacterium]